MMSSASSALIETVSINYEDFNDSFLTCGTCLSLYDGADHPPKLLPCSHTVCRSCLETIVETNLAEGTNFRCPICRETITLPRGGVSAFPPSFLVNQLLDLMARQRREIVPKCATHMTEELLFCETCDTIFCILCAGGAHGSNHTVIPFSIAIKRMSEILLYKAHLCVQNLNTAQETVVSELDRLKESEDKTLEHITQSFDAFQAAITKRKEAVLDKMRSTCEHKRKVLSEQLELIEAEKGRVEQDCEGLESEMEVRHITRKIADLNERLECTTMLAEPRENAFIGYLWKRQLQEFTNNLTKFGQVKISTTFPALTRVKFSPATTFLRSKVRVTTVDYRGNPRNSGGDPMAISLKDINGDELEHELTDHNDGSYTITYMPIEAGTHTLDIHIFGRPIKGSQFPIEVSPHISPIAKTGEKGTGMLHFSQPTSIVQDKSGSLYILDTGNNRIKVLKPDCTFDRHLKPEGLEKQSCTGIAMTPNQTIMAVNWRTKLITEIHLDGRVVKQFTSPELLQPTSIAVNSANDVIIADNCAECLFVFDNTGRLVKKFGGVDGQGDCKFKFITGLAVTSTDDIIVADNHIIVMDMDGEFKREVGGAQGTSKKPAQYGGVTVDIHGNVLASKTDRGKSYIEVYRQEDEQTFIIDSFTEKLKRPSGLVTTADHTVLVCDLGNHALKKYPYM